MRIIVQFVRKYPVSVFLFVVIWYLSLFFLPPHTRLDNVKFIDKWTHVVMYGGTCAVLWWEYQRQHAVPCWPRLFWLAWVAPIAMSGILELLQEYCTGGRRSGEWLDLAANATGVTLAALAGVVFFLYIRRK